FLIAGLFLGLNAIGGMERETFPDFASSRVAVTVAYPGATAEDVDQDICLVLGDSLQAITGLEEMTCQSVSGKATATLTMVEDGDITQFFNDVFSQVSAIKDLPEEAEDPSVAVQGLTEQIAVVAVSGLASDAALVGYADELATELAALPGVATATVRGISTLEYRVDLDDMALQRYGLSPREVADAIAVRASSSPLGTVETEVENYSLRIDGTRRSVADLNDLTIVEGSTGGVVRLSDVADVSLVLADAALRSEIDGKQAAIIVLTKSAEDDAIEAFAVVDAYLADLRAQFGGALELSIINDGTKVISDRISLVLLNAVQSLVLVFVIMCLFFSLRDALWISMALPFSFLLGLFVMNLFGVTINVISVLALLMSIGIIMDDSIVIAENIDKWREKFSPREAAVKGTQEVMAGVVSSFLTTAGVFGPLMFLSGEIGTILQVIPVVLLITLAASLVEAFLILPNHLSHAPARNGPGQERLLPRMLGAFCDRGVVPLVTVLTRWRYATLGVVGGVLILTLGLVTSGQVRLIGFPETDGDTLEIRIAMTPGLQSAQTQGAVNAVLAGIDQMDASYTPGTNGGVPLVQRVMVE
ncbi:MAG: efflux RND transporter permease subunit, partial [Yoonia sp.]|uniref:efflux RND transporter permease subunit n=1 Tax=Yoonia sp. TaxID=2212373 RepID=UPI00273E5189